jgi:predicted DNA-binding transcriptional regulator YafY
MSRAERLLELMQNLRLRRRPVAGQALAEELGVSLRTLYRDIGALQAQGARIEGEAGFGYVLKPGFTLPPLMFSLEEVEALALRRPLGRGPRRRGPQKGGARGAGQDRRRPAA